ncbi:MULTISPECIES: fimbrial protein [Enterobacter]|uniref:fimbrial protein n=1 Tax=Enterobacter TaxID=547 RepID=UPI0007ADB648|nr:MULTISPECIES: type 1 fimbrial protein [Enterobacter]AMZ77760.1 hypothetical protein A4308_12430 [Enterobacter sp. ODB01]EKS6337848.1 type 1 fimbrial protein [Enterobacter hormaechei]VAL43426.1 P pilus assembly protein, pilin FimA [Enterobacter kobei]
MRNKIYAIGLLGGAIFMSVNAYAVGNNATGLLTVDGNMVAQTCLVPQNDLTKTVNFDTVDVGDIRALAANAKIAGTTKSLDFNITGCPGNDGDTVSIRFDYNVETGKTNYLLNTSDSRGVLVGINKKGDDALIVPAGTIDATTTGGNATVEAEASLYRDAGSVFTGGINSTMNVTLVNP